MKPLDQCHLYAFVDAAYLRGQSVADVARALCDGGADLIQLRAKDWPHEDVLRAAAALAPITQAAGVGLVINDHPDIAQRVGADLCHLGQEDFFDAGLAHVRDVRPSGVRIGLSSHAPEQALRAAQSGADYIAIGPVFATPTKPGRPGVTLDYVRWAADHLQLPWFAIGGITLENLDPVLAAGARRVAVVSAILNAPNIARACQQFRSRLPSAAARGGSIS